MVVIDDNGAQIARSDLPHTVTFMPDADHAAILSAVNADITMREIDPWPPIPAAEWERATGHCVVEHTKEIKTAYESFKQKAAKTEAKKLARRQSIAALIRADLEKNKALQKSAE